MFEINANYLYCIFMVSRVAKRLKYHKHNSGLGKFAQKKSKNVHKTVPINACKTKKKKMYASFSDGKENVCQGGTALAPGLAPGLAPVLAPVLAQCKGKIKSTSNDLRKDKAVAICLALSCNLYLA